MLILLLVFGVFTGSTAVIFIKLCSEHPLLVAAYRLFLGALLLTPLYLKDYKKESAVDFKKNLRVTFLPGILLGLHFITWTMGVPLTFATNASLIVNMMVLSVPFFLYFMVNEVLTYREKTGTLIAIAGLLILGIADFQMDLKTLKGDILCFVSMLFLSSYMVMAKKNREMYRSLYVYIVPLYYIAGFFCFMLSLFFINPVKHYTLNNIIMIAGLGVIPTVFGHSINNYCMQRMRGQLVSIVNLGQFMFSGILAYIFLKEIPEKVFFVSTVFVVAGSIITIIDSKGIAEDL